MAEELFNQLTIQDLLDKLGIKVVEDSLTISNRIVYIKERGKIFYNTIYKAEIEENGEILLYSN